MKYALIGCGRISINHLRAARANGFMIAALCDIVPGKAEALLARAEIPADAGIKTYTDYKQMLAAEQPELVSIATESGKHAEIALYCIGHGIHTIIEKPMAMSLADADRIIAAAEARGVTVSVCQIGRAHV